MAILIAILLAIFSFIAKKADYKLVSRVLGVSAFLVFVGWLASGPGFAIVEFFQDPSTVKVNVPDNIPLPGGK